VNISDDVLRLCDTRAPPERCPRLWRKNHAA
jgi:hypothetical protein